MVGIRLFYRSKTTKYFEITYFVSLLELHEYKHSFVSVFEKHFVVYTKVVHFLLSKFDILCQ